MGAAFYLTIQGVNLTNIAPADNVRMTEVGGESNSTLEFDLEFPAGYSLVWLTGLSHDVQLQDLTNNRRLFKGNLVNVRRRHTAGRRGTLHCTALSYDSWLDRLYLPKWISKRPNGTKIATDREMVQNITSAVAGTPPGQFAWDAINTYVASTNTDMPVVKVDGGGSVRDILTAVAEAAATDADSTARRFYIDFDNHLHWFKGNESTTAPYLLGDASYTATVKATTGIVSLVAFREVGTAYDPYGVATVTLAGGYTQNVASLVPNEPMMPSITFNGTTGYASLAGASLHQGDGPWTVKLSFKRGATLGTAQTLVSAGATDYLIGFNTSNQLIVQKEGTGNNFVTDATYTDTSAHHLVVTRAVGTTTVYVDGVSKAGTTTARTFASAAGAVNIGRKLSTTDTFLTGTVQNFEFYSATLSAATVLAHYKDGMTIVPDEFEFETDVNGAGKHVYIKGGNANGTGWVSDMGNSNYNQAFNIDRPQSTSASLKQAIGKGFLKREAPTLHGGRATVTMAASTWRAGQTLTIDDNALGIGGSYALSGTYEIKQLDTYPNMGSGVCTYEIYFGVMPWSGTFDIQRKKRRSVAN